MRFLTVALFLFSVLFANELDNNITGTQNTTVKNNILSKDDLETLPKVLYLTYKDIPDRVIKGEIFTVTIKTLPVIKNFTDITYELSNSEGVKLLSEYPSREIDSKFYYETFYFLATSNSARLPDIKATILNYDDKEYRDTTLIGKKLNVLSLNPKKDFANIIADSFELLEYKTTSYNQKYNILVFSAAATNCDISAFKLTNVFKQGLESILESYNDSKITYYAIINKKIKNFSFTYFNVKKNKYELVSIPIVVHDDSVTTQTDLKPKDQSREILKIKIAGAVTLILLIMILWRKKYLYLIILIVPISYIAYLWIPSKNVCIKSGSSIHLLPVTNGTIFEVTPEIYHLQKEGKTKGFVKVKLQNNRIGWVKDEDICSY